MWWLVAVVGAGMLLAGLFVAAGGRGPEFDRSEELWGGLLFAAFGALALWVGYGNLRAMRETGPRRQLEGVELRVSAGRFRRGDEVQIGLTTTQLGLEVGLECIERYQRVVRAYTGAGTSTVRQTIEAVVHEEWQPATPSATFRIPRSAPYSYEGQIVSYRWRATVRRPRRLRSDLRTDEPIEVLP